MSNENLSLNVQKREGLGKGSCRKLRVKKLVPGVFYDAKGDNIPVAVEEMALSKLYHKTGSSTMFTLNIEGEERPSLIWKIQNHPLKKRIVHVDFFGVELGKEMRLSVPVEIQGSPKGVKEGGILEVYREQIEIICLPRDIPHSIIIDVSDMGVNQTVHVADVVMPEGVRALFEENFAVLGVTIPAEQSLEPNTGAEEGAEGEAE